MIAISRPDPALARSILVSLTARPSDAVPFDVLAAEAGVASQDLTPTLDAMEHTGQIERVLGTGSVTLGPEAARRLKRSHFPMTVK